MSEDNSITKWVMRATLLSAIATCAIAITNYQTLEVTSGTLGLLKAQFTISQRPRLLQIAASDPESDPTTIFVRVGKENERWDLGYWVYNITENSSFSLTYLHILTTDSSISLPHDSLLIGKTHFRNEISTKSLYMCGTDNLLRQKVIDTQNEGRTFYRYFFIRYEDESGNIYRHAASWKLIQYEVGSHPFWRTEWYFPYDLPEGL